MIRNGSEMIAAVSFDFSSVYVKMEGLNDMIKRKLNSIVQRFFSFAYGEKFRT